ncbi:hypothetical protein RRF57_006501 [Xylaria bambusicola]|uniref:Uncharacterized protein n=1 Tax=Xylaria bambusicola TaxID=326684 RepID=A0AAN7Z9W7_9PEZI
MMLFPAGLVLVLALSPLCLFHAASKPKLYLLYDHVRRVQRATAFRFEEWDQVLFVNGSLTEKLMDTQQSMENANIHGEWRGERKAGSGSGLTERVKSLALNTARKDANTLHDHGGR